MNTSYINTNKICTYLKLKRAFVAANVRILGYSNNGYADKGRSTVLDMKTTTVNYTVQSKKTLPHR